LHNAPKLLPALSLDFASIFLALKNKNRVGIRLLAAEYGISRIHDLVDIPYPLKDLTVYIVPYSAKNCNSFYTFFSFKMQNGRFASTVSLYDKGENDELF
jgi:hypothetical protein